MLRCGLENYIYQLSLTVVFLPHGKSLILTPNFFLKPLLHLSTILSENLMAFMVSSVSRTSDSFRPALYDESMAISDIFRTGAADIYLISRLPLRAFLSNCVSLPFRLAMKER